MNTLAAAFQWAIRQRPVYLLAGFFIGQAVITLAVTRKEAPLNVLPLRTFAERIGDWEIYQDGVIDQEMQSILHPDDYLLRQYMKRDGSAIATLFVAYFKSQRTGTYPHSPKNCLPGNGWVPYQSGTVTIPAGQGLPSIEVNRYLVAKEAEKSEVLYWYQTWNRVVASELQARIFLLNDSVRYNRTDTALVRILVPISGESDRAAEQSATRLATDVYHLVRAFIPPYSVD
jgi:EpsI family protein